MTALEFILWALVTVLDVGGSFPANVAAVRVALAYTKARKEL